MAEELKAYTATSSELEKKLKTCLCEKEKVAIALELKKQWETYLDQWRKHMKEIWG